MRPQPSDKWLLDAEVKSRIEKVNGRWEVSLIFIDTKDPKRFLVKKINDFRSQKLAQISANIMTNTAARDERGTQKVNNDDYNFNNN